MSGKKDSISDLMEGLRHGWQPSHSSVAQEFVRCWKERLGARVEIRVIGEDTVHFAAEMDNIRLRGMGEISCLLIRGSGSPVAIAVQEFQTKFMIPGRVSLVLAVSDEGYKLAKHAFSCEHCVVLHPRQIKELLDSTKPLEFLKQCVRQQIPRRWLIPFTILRPVNGVMFFGRRSELARLRLEENASFAIAGPGRIGKTSLLKQYRHELIRNGDPRMHRTFEISLYDCTNSSDREVARHIAMRIDPSRRSHKMTLEGLLHFLRTQRSLSAGPLELLLDEVDEVCSGSVFRLLELAARQGLVRLVIAGRGALLKEMLSETAPLAGRLELIRAEILDVESATELIRNPLSDLGFQIEGLHQFAEHAFQMTGRLPHLLQFCGKKLAELAIDEKRNVVSVGDLETLKWDFETAQYFTSPLTNLADPQARLLALLLLKEDGREMTVSSMRELAAREGLMLSHARTFDLCNALVINNVLAWKRASFRIATSALVDYARELGFLSDATEEARGEAMLNP